MNKIRLPRDGAEYAVFTFSPATFPVGTTLEAEIESVWYPIDTSVTPPRLLLKGPLMGVGVAGVPVTKDGPIRVRISSTPEVIVRGAGYVALVSRP